MRSPSLIPKVILYPVGLVCGLGSAFFVFYTARLLYVTRGLRAVRAGGGGAYVGAIVFPLLALGLGWLALRCVRLIRGKTAPPK